MSRLSQRILGMTFNNPVMPASGTFGFGREMSKYYDLSQLAAVVTKSITLDKRSGNTGIRVAETKGGMLNSIGLQNPGVDEFLQYELPFLENHTKNIIVNIAGSSVQEYVDICSRLDTYDSINAIEVNVSCPNVSSGGMAFGQDPDVLSTLIKRLKEVTNKALIMKLSPNVRCIQEIVKACEQAGADAFSMINTLKGLRMDLYNRQPLMDRAVAGLSGPAIKAVALAFVYEARQVTDLPIIGIGGIESSEDVLEMIMAGANAVQIGTANLRNPWAMPQIINALEASMDRFSIRSIEALIKERKHDK